MIFSQFFTQNERLTRLKVDKGNFLSQKNPFSQAFRALSRTEQDPLEKKKEEGAKRDNSSVTCKASVLVLDFQSMMEKMEVDVWSRGCGWREAGLEVQRGVS